MKASQFFVSTLKEAPADAEVVSHQLMLRAGFIKRLSAGIYTYMPMGLRVIRKIEAIVRAEMNRVSWPSFTEVKNTTIITLVAVIFFAIYLFLVDRVWAFLLVQLNHLLNWMTGV